MKVSYIYVPDGFILWVQFLLSQKYGTSSDLYLHHRAQGDNFYIPRCSKEEAPFARSVTSDFQTSLYFHSQRKLQILKSNNKAKSILRLWSMNPMIVVFVAMEVKVGNKRSYPIATTVMDSKHVY